MWQEMCVCTFKFTSDVLTAKRGTRLLCDGKANDGVSLGDVPWHQGGVRFHLSDGHIDRRQQAVCTQKQRRSPVYMAEMSPNQPASQIEKCK